MYFYLKAILENWRSRCIATPSNKAILIVFWGFYRYIFLPQLLCNKDWFIVFLFLTPENLQINARIVWGLSMFSGRLNSAEFENNCVLVVVSDNFVTDDFH